MMALAAEVDNQEILGALVDRLVPNADFRRCDDLTTLTDTWLDARPVPSEQDFIDEYALYQQELTAAADEEQAAADAQARFRNAKQDFRALIDILAPAYDGLTPQQRANLVANFSDLQSLTDNQFRNTIGFGLALYSIGLDYLERRERGG